MTRVELLRDLYIWAYERSTQEYLAIKQDLAEPDPLRLSYRDVIKATVWEVVVRADEDALSVIGRGVEKSVKDEDRLNVLALIVGELRRLHEGVLARYGLRPLEFMTWKTKQSAGTP